MEYYVVDVRSTKNVNGKDVVFDYCNIYYNENKANEEAKLLTFDNDVIAIDVHRWNLNSNGKEDIDWEYYGFGWINKNHREMKK